MLLEIYLDILVNDQASGASSVQGITITDTAIPGTSPTEYWWVSPRYDLPAAAQTQANLLDSTSDVYLPTILQRLTAKAKRLTGEAPDCYVVPQAIWDQFERIFNENKQGTLQKEMVGTYGFTVLLWRGKIPIVADDDMVNNQTGDVDGRIYGLNFRTLYMFWNSGAKFTAEDWVPVPGSNTYTKLINLYGNIATSNRSNQVVATGLWSPKDYSK